MVSLRINAPLICGQSPTDVPHEPSLTFRNGWIFQICIAVPPAPLPVLWAPWICPCAYVTSPVMRLSSVSTVFGPPGCGASGGSVQELAAPMTMPLSRGVSPPTACWNGLEIAQTVSAFCVPPSFAAVTKNSARGRSYGLHTLAGCVESVRTPPEVMPQNAQYANPAPAYIGPFGRMCRSSWM